MKKAYVFPGQGSQFPSMAKDLYDNSLLAHRMLEQANEILGFRITDVMFEGSADDLKATDVTQPAVFLHSVVMAACMKEGQMPDEAAESGFEPDMVAGHSLGEFSALTASGALSFEEGLRLVSVRARAMQTACEARPGTMAAIIGLSDDVIEGVCRSVSDGGIVGGAANGGIAGGGIVVAANYNCPGQVVISGEVGAVNAACELLKAAGARRALVLPVGGAFHSPLMEQAREELAAGIQKAKFNKPVCPIYQNVTASPTMDPELIKDNLLRQLTSPVLWTQSVRNMIADGADSFIELGPGKVLQGLIGRIRA